jgi:hypothetical protein
MKISGAFRKARETCVEALAAYGAIMSCDQEAYNDLRKRKPAPEKKKKP